MLGCNQLHYTPFPVADRQIIIYPQPELTCWFATSNECYDEDVGFPGYQCGSFYFIFGSVQNSRVQFSRGHHRLNLNSQANESRQEQLTRTMATTRNNTSYDYSTSQQGRAGHAGGVLSGGTLPRKKQ
jgi:hypothetical protein